MPRPTYAEMMRNVCPDNAALVALTRRAHADWQLLLLKAGPDNIATRIRRRKLELLLDACAPRAPKTWGNA